MSCPNCGGESACIDIDFMGPGCGGGVLECDDCHALFRFAGDKTGTDYSPIYEYQKYADPARARVVKKVARALRAECSEANVGAYTHGLESAMLKGDSGEWRFGGGLGFGGKLWWEGTRVWVSCYAEDETDERNARIASLNAQLAQVVEAATSSQAGSP